MSSKYSGGPTETERCIEPLLDVLQRYAGCDENAASFSKLECPKFMNTKLESLTKNQKDPGVRDHMMKKLYMNYDGQMDFGKFLNVIGGLAQACHIQVLSSPTSSGSQKP
ncbi:protein S100-A11-like [Heteronotia binoei]|uniref:protein S100-A11-like n=1 Tax=Heteronotia binoei TaxID=13085 RepID=UPI002931D85C|nr:protein S100-A11-like [Heteronotia binoei]